MRYFVLFALLNFISFPIVSQTKNIAVECDPETGLCVIPEYAAEAAPVSWKSDEEIIYVGDPMCSWCWGISPQLNALQRYGREAEIPFSLVMGGLRPGGGEEWNKKFKDFLKHHWEEVNSRSGQPFGYSLFERADFNYDTEPACRAVVTIRDMTPEKTLSFYELVQNRFYVQSEDPKELDFYQPICEELSIDFAAFSKRFVSEKMKQATQQDFALNRQWGVRGFPAVIFRKGDKLYLIAQGYSEYEEMRDRIVEVNKG